MDAVKNVLEAKFEDMIQMAAAIEAAGGSLFSLDFKDENLEEKIRGLYGTLHSLSRLTESIANDLDNVKHDIIELMQKKAA